MATDIILNRTTNDITFSGNDLAFFEEDSPENIAQRLEIKLRSYKGEWFRDINYGIPWIQSILSQGNSKALADTYVRKTITQDPAIKSIVSYTSTTTDQKLNVSFKANLISGSYTIIQLEI